MEGDGYNIHLHQQLVGYKYLIIFLSSLFSRLFLSYKNKRESSV